MELLFLAILLLVMATALASGYPVAFALPGSAILTIGLAALCGKHRVYEGRAAVGDGMAHHRVALHRKGVTHVREGIACTTGNAGRPSAGARNPLQTTLQHVAVEALLAQQEGGG